jgi:uncharacterized integral membrane protein (TIGR00697 family)
VTDRRKAKKTKAKSRSGEGEHDAAREAAKPGQATPAPQRRQYRYYDLVMAAFVTVLLCSNLIGPGKLCVIAGFTFGAGNLFFPMSYVFGDILTEVYGYARSRRVIWAGFGAMLFATIMTQVVLHVPVHGESAEYQKALEMVFGSTWRIVLASMAAFWAGEFANSFVLAKLKIATRGRHLWSRTIGSTLVGQTVDTAIFYPIAFIGTWSTGVLIEVILVNVLLKVLWEILATPVTYWIVGALKRAEREDYFDRDTNFTPFSLRD